MKKEIGVKDDIVLSKIGKLSEIDLTEKYIMPLFKAMKYEKVDYFGGQNEKGKDIICWKINEIDEKELTVVQVKKIKISASSSPDFIHKNLQTQ